MSGIHLWHDLDETEDEDEKEDLYDFPDFFEDDPDNDSDEDDFFVICLECGAPVLDGEACDNCGYIGG